LLIGVTAGVAALPTCPVWVVEEQPLALEELRVWFNDLQARGLQVTACSISPAQFEAYEDALSSHERFMDPDLWARGLENLRFKGATMVPDPSLSIRELRVDRFLAVKAVA
jgi:hypothetical protein